VGVHILATREGKPEISALLASLRQDPYPESPSCRWQDIKKSLDQERGRKKML